LILSFKNIRAITVYSVAPLFVVAFLLFFQFDFQPYTIFVALLLGWFSADFLLGVTHFLMDYYPCPRHVGLKELTQQDNRSSIEYKKLKYKTMKPLSPIVRLAFDFKTHHIFPTALSRRSFPALVTTPLAIFLSFVLLVIISLSISKSINVFWFTYSYVTVLGLYIGQYIHALLHSQHTSKVFQFLQKMHLLQKQHRHDTHHDSYEKYYTVLNGWSDWLVNPIAAYAVSRQWVKAENFELY